MHLDQATGGVALMAVAVYPPPSLCMECGTARCVGGSMPTSMAHHVDAFGQPYYSNRALTIDSQYVDGVSLTHGQYPRKHIWTFAAALMKLKSNTDLTVPALTPPPLTLELSLLSLVRTTSVRLAVETAMQTEYTQLIHSGMGVAVAPVAPAVPSTTLHGSVRPSLSQPLMILSCGCVLMMVLLMKMLF